MQTLDFRIEKHAPPPPKHQAKGRPRVDFPFEQMQVGQSAVINRAVRTIQRRMYEFQKTPAGAGTRFKVRRVTPSLSRIWRLA
jgi:hypothetical protein